MTKASALITGASNGIGREIARQLAAAGLTVHVGSRDQERGRRAVDEIGGDARLLMLDVTDGRSIAGAAGHIRDLDILINNAGIMADGRTATEADVDSFRRTYETNVFGVVAASADRTPARPQRGRRTAGPDQVRQFPACAALTKSHWSRHYVGDLRPPSPFGPHNA